MSKQNLKKVVVIGGSDPSGGAGIQADLFTLSQLGVPAASIITAITAQNEKKFLSYETVSSKNFNDQLNAVTSFAEKSIVKIGMIGNSRFISILQDWFKKIKPKFIILDPVIRSTTQANLIDSKGIVLLKNNFMDSVDLITPNLSELAILSELEIIDLSGMQNAAKKILKKSSQKKSRLKWILAKGGHLSGNATDLLIGKNQSYSFSKKRIRSKEVHGTGCTLASAIAGYLFQGKKIEVAVWNAMKIVRKKIVSSL